MVSSAITAQDSGGDLPAFSTGPKSPRANHIRRPLGKAPNQNLPATDILNFLPHPPKLWPQDQAAHFIRLDGSFQAKIRFLD